MSPIKICFIVLLVLSTATACQGGSDTAVNEQIIDQGPEGGSTPGNDNDSDVGVGEENGEEEAEKEPEEVAGTHFYISLQGDDSAIGSQVSPFFSLEKARDTIRAMTNKEEKITVWIDDGEYHLAQSFNLTEDDLGSESAPIVYRAINKGAVVLSNRTSIALSAFQSISDPTVASLIVDPSAREHVRWVGLSDFAITNNARWPDTFSSGSFTFLELYANDQRLMLSRYPNDGEMTMQKVIQNEPGVFQYRDDRHQFWQQAAQENRLWLLGYWRVAWQHNAILANQIDVGERLVYHKSAISLGIGDKYTRPEGNGAEPYHAINLLEEIDLPGEWSIDFNKNILYLYPPEGAEEIIIADDDSAIIKMQNSAFITFKDLVFDVALGNAIEIQGGHHNVIENCEIKNVGKEGVRIDGGTDNGVQGSHLHQLGAGGIYLNGGDRATLTAANNFAINNHIHHFGIIKKTYAGGVQIDGVGNYVAHNEIHHAPHVGVYYQGNNHLFEYNNIYDITQVSNDMGAFYSWNDWTGRGNEIRFNYIHDSHNAHAFYVDDGDSGDNFHHNVIKNVDTGCFIGGGAHNICNNNIFINMIKRAVHVDNRGVARGYNLSNSKMVDRLTSVDFDLPPWSTQYPEMQYMLEEDYPLDLPTGSRVECNIAVNSATFKDFSQASADEWGVILGKYASIDEQSIIFDESFHPKDLKSAAWLTDGVDCVEGTGFEGIAFEDIDFEKIGLLD